MTDLNNTLAKVIAQVESGGFPYALRFEDALFERMKMSPPTSEGPAIRAANHCNYATGVMIHCTSYGLFQIMGFNLYGMLGWKQSVATFLWDAEQQLSSFADFCAHNGINPATFDFTDETALEHFAKIYNGPGAIADYVAKMKAAYAALPA